MSTKRIAIGQIGGVMDIRIARPGFTADVDDPNDRTKISFAASRFRNPSLVAAGIVNGVQQWASLGVTLPAPVPVFFAFIRAYGNPGAPGAIMSENQRSFGPNGAYNNQTAFCAVVTNSQIMIVNPGIAGYPLSNGFGGADYGQFALVA